MLIRILECNLSFEEEASMSRGVSNELMNLINSSFLSYIEVLKDVPVVRNCQSATTYYVLCSPLAATYCSW